MSTYRDAPPGEPLLLTIGQLLLAIERESGALHWQLRLPMTVTRMFRTANRLLLVGSDRVLGVDLETGRSLGGTKLPFTPRTGLLHEGRLFVAGSSGVACLDLECNLLWSAIQPAITETWSFDFSLRCRREDGTDLWNVDMGVSATPPGLCIGDEISQPDLES
jgi:hypothetical protein